MAGRPLDTIYFGGGTPTSLDAEDLDRLLTKLRETFPVEQALEFTVEAGRPDSITREKLEVLKCHGVTRISINPQTMKQETLDIIGRHHTVDMVCLLYTSGHGKGHGLPVRQWPQKHWSH